MKSDLIEVEVALVAKTEKAVCVHTGDKTKAFWIPLSQCEIEKAKHGKEIYTLTLPEWLAFERGLS